MSYWRLRLGCLLRGHDWRETSSPVGIYHRCWHCYSERAAPKPSHPVPPG